VVGRDIGTLRAKTCLTLAESLLACLFFVIPFFGILRLL
jgi:hypothetical protein